MNQYLIAFCYLFIIILLFLALSAKQYPQVNQSTLTFTETI